MYTTSTNAARQVFMLRKDFWPCGLIYADLSATNHLNGYCAKFCSINVCTLCVVCCWLVVSPMRLVDPTDVKVIADHNSKFWPAMLYTIPRISLYHP